MMANLNHIFLKQTEREGKSERQMETTRPYVYKPLTKYKEKNRKYVKTLALLISKGT